MKADPGEKEAEDGGNGLGARLQGEEGGEDGKEGGGGGGEERGWWVVEAIGPAPQRVSPSRSLREVCCGRSREGGDSLRSVCSQCIT